MIYKKLSQSDKKLLIDTLFDFGMDENGVIYDDEGDEFYGNSENNKYDFSNLKEIIDYVKDESFKKGIRHNQREIKKALNL